MPALIIKTKVYSLEYLCSYFPRLCYLAVKLHENLKILYHFRINIFMAYCVLTCVYCNRHSTTVDYFMYHDNHEISYVRFLASVVK